MERDHPCGKLILELVEAVERGDDHMPARLIEDCMARAEAIVLQDVAVLVGDFEKLLREAAHC